MEWKTRKFIWNWSGEQGDCISGKVESMALEMKMRCMHCERPLSRGGDAFICSFECTFCVDCAQKFEQVCPNCEGELVRRPRRKASSAS